jgi:tRNA G18 (ribose-2'-O)-methylase SpoU
MNIVKMNTLIMPRNNLFLNFKDPMNMGAILRTAVFLGVDKVVSSEYDRYTSICQPM